MVSCECKVDTEATVLAFKQKISEKAGVAPELQRLIYKGRVMKEDQNTLASYSEKMALGGACDVQWDTVEHVGHWRAMKYRTAVAKSNVSVLWLCLGV